MYKLHVEREIACSHRLNLHEGKCFNLHGHNYKVIVDIKCSTIQDCGGASSDGMLLDFGTIKNIVDELDHKHLNEFFEIKASSTAVDKSKSVNLYKSLAIQPTSERLCLYFATEILNQVYATYEPYNFKENFETGIRVRMYESTNNYAEYSSNYYK